jgi:hypothetical protein
MSSIAVPPILATLVGRIAVAVPARARPTFLELLLGAAATKSGHVTDAILSSGVLRGWTTYFWFLERGRWSWLQVWDALLGVLTSLFAPAVWHVVLDDSVVERFSTRAPGSMVHHNHTAKPNRPRFLRGQGWLCLAAVVERGFQVGAVPLMPRLLGQRLGQVRVLLDAWFMRGWLIRCTLADGHTVIGRVRRDLALYTLPRSPRRRRPGRPRKYGARLTPARVDALPVHRSTRILYGQLAVVRWRSCRVAARFLHGRVVRAVWVELEHPDRRDKPPEQRLLLCTDPDLPAPEVITAYAKRWAVEPLFKDIKHGWGLKDAWQRSRQGLMRWVTLLGVGYALTQMLAYTEPARLDGLAEPAPWRPPGTQTAGVIQAGIARILRGVGLPAFLAAMSAKLRADARHAGGSSSPIPTQAAETAETAAAAPST